MSIRSKCFQLVLMYVNARNGGAARSARGRSSGLIRRSGNEIEHADRFGLVPRTESSKTLTASGTPHTDSSHTTITTTALTSFFSSSNRGARQRIALSSVP